MKLSLSGKTSLAGSILQKSPARFVPTHSESGAAVSAWARNGHCSSESQGQVLQLRAAVAVLLVLIKGSGCEFSVRDNKHPSLTHRWPGSAFCKSRFPQPGFLQIRSLRIFSQGKQFLIFRSKPHLKDSFFFPNQKFHILHYHFISNHLLQHSGWDGVSLCFSVPFPCWINYFRRVSCKPCSLLCIHIMET